MKKFALLLTVEGPVTEIPQDPERVDFDLASVNDSGIAGIAAFIPEDDGSTTVYIELTGTNQELHPATINFGDTESGGTAAITLNSCECRISTTKVTQYDNGISVDFAELMSFDGHLNIYQSPTDNTIVAHTNIGSNAF
jgi:hypothetical protein